jgi:signal transduction histidine kinase
MIPNFSGMLQMLMDTDLVTTQQDYVRTAQASAKAPFSLINEVLEMVPFDLRTVCDDILSLFCWKAQEKGLEVIKDYIYLSMLPGTAVLLYSDCTDFIFVPYYVIQYNGSSWQCMFLPKFRKH